ncbi:aconitate hydratase [Chitinophaga terrae (ex Kim and Jung 2007)]|uniref:aconitate hydratase AcnA n=1 Tax=Chitinophaga terrae (ex Kim and Jung 2007) TaxID=408074 RepID=UPI00278850AB|nr:aconitate hydratase AcnA [Chitinophaga terrae (ex Kim and Jung 2007)]MDQ0108916.1 aconitate hydratase [Chitinophaga terrae (ex Kim and Jung 2007)]
MEPKIALLSKLEQEGKQISRLPFSIRILLENVLRNKDNFAITDEHVETLVNWTPGGTDKEVPFKPARVLMQDFTGVPAVVDLASIRAEVIRQGKDGAAINPAIPVDLVVDHSVQVDFFGTDYSYRKNVAYEYERNKERYQLLKWAQQAFRNFTVVPPGMGICHQVNLEYLAKGVISRDGWIFPDTLVGTDSHTPMVNGIGVLGWGVGGIEAEAAILGQPIYFTCPQVVGLKLTGKLTEGVTATDMVLAITELLRKYGVVDKFVEVFGDGLDHLTVPDRATISNMSPEFGCTVTYFPVDDQTLQYMRRTNRPADQISLVESYCRQNMLWRNGDENITYSDILELDLNKVQAAVAGPKRPQDRILVKDLGNEFETLLGKEFKRMYTPEGKRRDTAWLSEGGSGTTFTYEIQKPLEDVAVEVDYLKSVRVKLRNEEYVLSDGAITIAAITSCTNTSNPSVMIGAGLVAKKAISRGLTVKPWVKTSLAPGSRVVTDYLKRANLLEELEALRFHVVGYGCTSCIGNSGPLPPAIAEAVDKGNLVVASVLSGNRNFEARVHPQVKMNFLASPMLVVAYAIVGRVDIDLLTAPLGYDPNGEPVYLRDIWPTQEEINQAIAIAVKQEDFENAYSVIFDGDEQWQGLLAPTGNNYHWSNDSTYIREAPFFKGISSQLEPLHDITGARVLLKLGDSVTTDHISPAGSFKSDTPAGKYLLDHGIDQRMFNSYGSRRGNHEVMVRGTFANVRLKNDLSPKEGGYTTLMPSGTVLSVYDASVKYAASGTPLIVLAGKEYGSGSSRDWAAKGTNLLGVKAIIAESYERIHRSNLVGMGILPLEYMNGQTAASLNLTGTEQYDITGLESGLTPGKVLKVKAIPGSGEPPVEFDVKCKLNSEIEIEYYLNGGILQYVLRDFLARGVSRREAK